MFDFGLLVDNWTSFFQTPMGAAFFVPLYAIWVTLLLPGVWASMVAGALYGLWLGSFLVFLGACLGAVLAFFLARSLLRGWVQRWLANFPKLHLVQKAVSREGLKLVVLTRLSPAFPFSILNFVYGLSEISVRDYSLGLIGILPGTLLFCSLGALAGDIAHFGDVLSDRTNTISYAFKLIGLLATITAVWVVSRIARNALKELDA